MININHTILTSALCLLYFSQVNSTLKKCFCDKNEIRYNDSCIPEPTFVSVIDLGDESFLEAVKNTSDFENVLIGDVECPPGLTKGRMDAYEFVLTMTNNLYHTSLGIQFIPEHYCIEHFKQNDTLSWEAFVCFNVTVNHCCPPGKFLVNDICSSKDGFENKLFTPPVYDGYTEFYPDYSIPGPEISISSCLHSPEPIISNLDENNYLTLHDDGITVFTETKGTHLGNDYCIAQTVENDELVYVAKYCPLPEKYINKCCPPGQVFFYDHTCQDDPNAELELTYYNSYYPAEIVHDHILPINNAMPTCEPVILEETEYKILDNGQLLDYADLILEPSKYCIDRWVDTIKNISTQRAVVCSAFDEDSSEERWVKILFTVCMCISCLFFVMTLAVYIGVKDIRIKTPSKYLISEVSALLVSYLITVIVTVSPQPSEFNAACFIAGCLGHGTVLASFFWLNIMSFDVWSNFTKIKNATGQDHGSRRFTRYSLYGWGIPTIIVILSIIIELLPQSYNIYRPGYSHYCYIDHDFKIITIYLYAPIAILLAMNVGFFVQILIFLVKAHKESENMFKNESRSTNVKKDTHRARLYLKLFFLMGLTWIAEILSKQTKHLGKVSIYVWLLCDVINALKGLIIFIIFVCKRGTIEKIKKAWLPWLKPKRKGTSQVTGGTPGRKISTTSMSSMQTGVTGVYSSDVMPMQTIADVE